MVFIVFFFAAFILAGIALRYGIVIPLKEIHTVLFHHDYIPPPEKLKFLSPEFKEL
jgi:hypothetical protein